jgi:glycosyltransferase involved in cell wall biosynthesis
MSDPRIKVLFFIPALVPGGAERVVTTLLRNMSREKFDVSLAVVNQQDSVFSEELPKDVPVIDLRAPRLRYGLHRIVRHIWKVKPDVVFSTIDYFNVTLGSTRPLWPRRTRFIARPTILFSAAFEENGKPRLWRALNRLAVANTDLLIFQSNAMEHDYRKSIGWFDGASVVIPNPLDFSFVQERASCELHRPIYDNQAFNLVAAGRLEVQKGFDAAIEAIALIRNKSVHLTILGEGSLRSALEQRANELGIREQVHVLGYQHNPYPYYSGADGFLLSSRFEGFPNVVIEALSCGTPVIATPVAGLGEILEKIPQCEMASGYTAPALAEALTRFIARGRQRVDGQIVSQFDARQVVLKYEECFASVGGAFVGAKLPWRADRVMRSRLSKAPAGARH